MTFMGIVILVQMALSFARAGPSGFLLPYPNYNPDSGNINIYFPLYSEFPNAPITTTETVRFIVTRENNLKETVSASMLHNACKYITFCEFLATDAALPLPQNMRTNGGAKVLPDPLLVTSDTAASWQGHIMIKGRRLWSALLLQSRLLRILL